MTLLFFDGLDNCRTTMKPDWDGQLWNGQQTGRDGTPNGAGSLAGPSGQQKVLQTPGNPTTLLVGCAFLWNNGNVLNGSQPIFALKTGLGAGTDCLTINMDGGAHLQVRSGDRGATVRAVGTYGFNQNAWNHVQFRLQASATAAVCQMYVNGSATPDINYTGIGGSNGPITGFALGGGTGNIGDATWFDDVWICDTVDATATQGRPNNTLLGDLRVVTLMPTGAGDAAAWTPNTAVANWTTVDENLTNTSDYVSAAAAGLQDLYTMADVPANAASVYGVRAGVYAQKSDAGAAFLKPLVKQGDGTLTTQAAQALGTSWTSYWGAILPTKSNGALWTPADVNALQVGIESA